MTFEQGRNMALIVLSGPLISGLLSTYLLEGRVGVRNLFSRMFKWRVGIGWYAAALLIFPVLILAVLSSLSAFYSSDFSPNFFSFGIIGGLMAGFIEETGWMGYAYPRMQSKYGPMRATIYLGLIHGVWHLAADVLGAYYTNGAYWLPRFVVMWMVAMVAMRVILVWIYSNTGSLLLAQLTHASSTGFLIMLGPSTTPANETFWWAIYAVVLWILAATILMRYGKQFIREPKRVEGAVL
ncbi:MAG: CPBP family intramembrane metalloprotease [Anaerolineales bacterium]|nr:CPBP family intramembrane metalloprotease [Anaerolineales bacterium]